MNEIRMSGNQANSADTNAQGTQIDDPLPEWDLSDLYSSAEVPELKSDLELIGTSCTAFVKNFEGKIGDLSPEGLLECLKAFEAIEERSSRVLSFAQLRFHQDSLDPQRGKFANDCMEKITEFLSPLVFFDLEINEIADDRFSSIMRANAELAKYRQFFNMMRKMRPHLLSNELERYVSDKSVVGAAAWNRLFDETFAAMKFDVGRETVGLEETLNRLSGHDRDMRELSAKALATGFKEKLPLISLITNTLAKDKEIEDRWRKFESPQAARHHSNDIEAEVVNSLRDSLVAAYPKLSHRYYKLKANWLGLEKLEVWDRSAPLPVESERTIGWQQAREIVISSFSDFSVTMSDIADEFFKRNWIDAAVKPGKSAGAFSHPTVADVHPYILVNYQGRSRDAMILAHELGHGIHQTLAAKQGELLSRTPLTVAETASVFCEMLTFRKLLGDVRSKNERKSLLSQKIEDMINTVVRQIAFYDFECRLHDQRRNGELTADEIGSIWMDIQRESLGPAFNFMDGYETFWSYVPHFVHAPFYVYAYSFGQCLVLALFAEYENGFPDFESKYIDMLTAGGSRNYRDLLQPFGIDVATPEFWDKGLNLIAGMIDELESLED